MAYDGEHSRRRAERIVRGSKTTTSQPIPTAAPGGGGENRFIGIIRKIEGDILKWQRIRYADNPPQVGRYEAFGEIKDGYPIETAIVAHYKHWVFGPGTVTALALPIFATKRRGAWIIELYMKADYSVLDPSAVVYGGGQG